MGRKKAKEYTKAISITVKQSTYDKMKALQEANPNLKISNIVEMAVTELLDGECTPLKEKDAFLIKEDALKQLLGIAEPTMKKYKLEGKFKIISFGRELRYITFTKDEFKEFLSENIFNGYFFRKD